jgi:hypothetical protein
MFSELKQMLAPHNHSTLPVETEKAIAVVSLHNDTGTTTGEKVVLCTLAAVPDLRENNTASES